MTQHGGKPVGRRLLPRRIAVLVSASRKELTERMIFIDNNNLASIEQLTVFPQRHSGQKGHCS
jgi:hypothetical protein